jgi:hypothetical protein
LWKNQHSLSELVAPEEFKSYEDLKKRLDRVLGLASSKALSEVAQSSKLMSTKQESASDLDLSNDDLPSNNVDVDDDLSYLQALANED